MPVAPAPALRQLHGRVEAEAAPGPPGPPGPGRNPQPLASGLRLHLLPSPVLGFAAVAAEAWPEGPQWLDCPPRGPTGSQRSLVGAPVPRVQVRKRGLGEVKGLGRGGTAAGGRSWPEPRRCRVRASAVRAEPAGVQWRGRGPGAVRSAALGASPTAGSAAASAPSVARVPPPPRALSPATRGRLPPPFRFPSALSTTSASTRDPLGAGTQALIAGPRRPAGLYLPILGAGQLSLQPHQASR